MDPIPTTTRVIGWEVDRTVAEPADTEKQVPVARQNTPRGRNCTEIRGPACATLGTACSQVR
jgi:hypothetical protein